MNPAPTPLSQLNQRIEQLLELARRLDEENRQLRSQQEQWQQERAALISKNDQARSRVEAMIQRLKALEHNA
ncbi:TIGR02449 family protein [Pseudomarimonas arenosa]|uniref:TIGR02449 family protein n=1 Tax=Pseudomarimonas arenosa TaxID=2774145 RepID=A0AAW3ZN46_9GAMM|nr:TIGR02449 family protein [Pseudomarimonas arenosa]MBD8527491.1 TIGR02449 family protein [Pseudomarimonas arenosa]